MRFGRKRFDVTSNILKGLGLLSGNKKIKKCVDFHCVYFVVIKLNNKPYLKIGKTAGNPESRIGALQYELPCNAELFSVGAWYGNRDQVSAVEAALIFLLDELKDRNVFVKKREVFVLNKKLEDFLEVYVRFKAGKIPKINKTFLKDEIAKWCLHNGTSIATLKPWK